MNKEQIADYAWIEKTQRSWHLWLGNPFCVSREIIPLKKATKQSLIKFAQKAMKKEKKRFEKQFKDVKWETLTPLLNNHKTPRNHRILP